MTDVSAGTAAPEVPVTPAPGAQPVNAPDTPAGQDQAQPQGDEPVKAPRTYSEEEMRKTVGERLRKEQRRLERTLRAELRAEMAERQLQERDSPQQRQTQPKGAPKPEDFGNDYEAFIVARAKYELKQELSQEQERTRTETAAQQREREDAEEAQEFHDKVISRGVEKYGDEFVDAIRGNVPFTPPMAKALLKLPNGHEVAFHLANNVNEAVRISKLSAVEQVWEVKDLSAKLSAPPQTTKVPPPIVPNSGNASTKKDWKDMGTEEHIKAWANRKR